MTWGRIGQTRCLLHLGFQHELCSVLGVSFFWMQMVEADFQPKPKTVFGQQQASQRR